MGKKETPKGSPQHPDRSASDFDMFDDQTFVSRQERNDVAQERDKYIERTKPAPRKDKNK